MSNRNLVVVATIFLCTLGVASAQDPSSSSASSTSNASSSAASSAQATPEMITVEAPRRIRNDYLPLGRGAMVTLSAAVRYGDLDLRTDNGAGELRDRIDTAANEVCSKLDTMYPQGSPTKEDCERRAVDKAMVDARAAIDDARSAH